VLALRSRRSKRCALGLAISLGAGWIVSSYVRHWDEYGWPGTLAASVAVGVTVLAVVRTLASMLYDKSERK
jgi:hypothetical protein